jgi:hypothetical protein
LHTALTYSGSRPKRGRLRQNSSSGKVLHSVGEAVGVRVVGDTVGARVVGVAEGASVGEDVGLDQSGHTLQ